MPAEAKDERASADASLRLVAALILAPLAIAAAWAGSSVHAGVVAVAAAGMLDEWLDGCGHAAAGCRGRTNRAMPHVCQAVWNGP